MDVVVSTADLSLGMVNAPSVVAPGGAVSYTLRFGNPSGASSVGAVLAVPVPAGTSFVSASDGATLNGSEVQWNVGALAASATGQRQFVVTVNAQAANGSVVAAAADLREAATGRSLARANAATMVLANSNTQVTMTAAPDPVRPGEFVQYAVTATNRSANASTYTLTAQVPSHTTVPAGSIAQTGSCGLINAACPAGGTIRWIQVIGGGQSFSVAFAALVNTTNPPPNGTLIRSTATAEGANSGATAAVDVAIAP